MKKLFSRKFIVVLITITVAANLLTGSDLVTVLVSAIAAYNLGNIGEWWVKKDVD